MSISLSGRTVLVTGVSSGLGEGVARVFAALGARVIGVARRADKGRALAWDIERSGGSMWFVPGDITDPACRQAAIDACLARSGRLDILINNAGVSGVLAAVGDYPAADWSRTVDLNLTAAFHLCQLAVPLMSAQGDGVILNIASINARFGVTKMAAYCASKAGLVPLTKVIAAEGVANNVRANAIILGGVLSEMNVATTIAMAKSAAGAGTTVSEERAERGRRLAAVTYEDLRRDRLAYGSPETVVERLRDLTQDLRLSGIIAEMNVGGLVPREHILESVRLYADEVVPALRDIC